MDRDLKLDQALIRVGRRWYIVGVCAAIGGVLGYLYHLTQPPIYDAYSVMTVSLNPDRAQPLTLYDQDLSLGKIAGIVSSTQVWEASVRGDQLADPEVDVEQVLGVEPTVTHWLARKGTRWELTVASSAPSSLPPWPTHGRRKQRRGWQTR